MSNRIALILCIIIAGAFGALSYRAVLTKSPTWDEPLHAASAYVHVFLSDDRLDPENPPLWKWWAMIPVNRDALHFDPNDPTWAAAVGSGQSLSWSATTLFRHPPNDGVAMINRARLAMVMIGVAVCLMAAWWAFQIAGPWAAITSAILVALDPTFLAHAPLVKNDVAIALAFLAATMAMWRLGRRLTLANALALALSCAAAIDVKFSGVILPFIVAAGLLYRALNGTPWNILGRDVALTRTKLLVAALVLLSITIVTFGTIWASYGFRYNVSVDPTVQLRPDSSADGFVDRVAEGASALHLLPQAFCEGFIRQHHAIGSHRNYLLGEVSERGWWYYFPITLAVKLPLATLAAIVLAVLFSISRKWDLWTIVCLIIPAAVYMLAAMSSNLDHGIRHLLPILPAVFVGVAVAFAKSLNTWPRAAASCGAILLLGLAVESFAAYPNYIAFFNAACGGERGGLALLGDSNLDWGQDLPLLARWQHDNPHTKLYLAYFGTADPAFYGIEYSNLPGGYWLGPPSAAPDPKQPGVIAVSASVLQGIYALPPWDQMYEQIRGWEPREILGGSIYLYDFPPQAPQH